MAAVKKKTIAFSYVRFSTPEQEKGDSLRRQRAARDAWLARHPEVVLDETLKLEDKGVSGHRGKHRSDADKYALARFVQLVDQKMIPVGSYLIIENLDRLSREDVHYALELLLQLTRKGVRIVQLTPAEDVFTAPVEPMKLMMAIMELARGNSESVMKSERLSRAWEEKRKKAVKSGTVVTSRCPCWLRVVDGRYEMVARACSIVRRIFALCIEGYGVGAITNKLNKEGVAPFGRGKSKSTVWAQSYIVKILTNPAVFGEYQPHTNRAGAKRAPIGDPIPNYYPVVVSEKDWYAAKAARESRRNSIGRPPKTLSNPFAGLLKDGIGGGTVHAVEKGGQSGVVLLPYLGRAGVKGHPTTSFPFGVFERAVLSQLVEVDPKSVIGAGESSRVDELAGRLAENQTKTETLKAALMKVNTDVYAAVDALKNLQEEKEQLGISMAMAKQEEAASVSQAWRDVRSLVKLVESDEEMRVRLRAVLGRIVDSIWCVFARKGSVRLAQVQVWFTGGTAYRSMTIVHKAGTGGSVGDRPAKTWVTSLRQPDGYLQGLPFNKEDLRDRTEARDVKEFLEALNETDFKRFFAMKGHVVEGRPEAKKVGV